MKSYTIADSSTEKIEFRANESQFALVQIKKQSEQWINGDLAIKADVYKTIILNQREVLSLYQAIQEEVLNKGGK